MRIYRSYVTVVDHMQTRLTTGFQRPVETGIHRRTDAGRLVAKDFIINYHLFNNVATLLERLNVYSEERDCINNSEKLYLIYV